MSELERTLESIRDIGPQRATPSSVARIQAQAKQLAAEVDELRDREVSVGSMDDFADMAKQLAALREENERLKSSRQRLFDLVRHCRIELHDEGLITDEEYAILADDPDSLSRLHGYDSLAEELARLRDERAVHVGEIEHLRAENDRLKSKNARLKAAYGHMEQEVSALRDREITLGTVDDMFDLMHQRNMLQGRIVELEEELAKALSATSGESEE